MARLDGKVALITGGSRGIGRATAYRFARLGASLYLAADETEAELATVAAECQRLNPGGRTSYGLHDLTGRTEAEAMVGACLAAFGRVDILVNNAGVRCRKKFGEFTLDDFDFVVGVNLRAPFMASQAVLPAMRRAGGGRIIHVASQLGEVAMSDHSLYGAAKAGLIYLTKAMAYELAREGISVNAVSPGPIATAYNLDRLKDNPEVKARMESYAPVGRFGEPDEVAEAIAFLASSDGTYIHGHNLLVDGGFVVH